MTQPTRSLRLQKRSTRSLNTLSGSVGEIFYDSETRALRLYTENQGTSVTIADRTWVVNNTFDGNYNNLINLPAIPDITGLASESFVTAAVSGLITIDDVNIDLSTIGVIGDVDVATNPLADGQILQYDGTNWINVTPAGIEDTNTTYVLSGTTAASGVNLNLTDVDGNVNTVNILAESGLGISVTGLDEITITGSGLDATAVGLGNVTNESKATMFTDPTFTGATSFTGNLEVSGHITGPASRSNNLWLDGPTIFRNINLPDQQSDYIIANPGVDLQVRSGNLTLGYAQSESTVRLSWRDNTGQLAYIDPIGDWGLSGTGSNGLGIQTDGQNTEYGWQITQNYGIVTRREELRPYKIIAPAPSGVTDIDVFEFLENGNYLWWLPESTNSWTINLTNVPEPGDGMSTPRLGNYNATAKFMITQGATATLPTALQINSVAQTILWEGGVTPSATVNGYDILEFDLRYFWQSNFPDPGTVTWVVAGKHTSYS